MPELQTLVNSSVSNVQLLHDEERLNLQVGQSDRLHQLTLYAAWRAPGDETAWYAGGDQGTILRHEVPFDNTCGSEGWTLERVGSVVTERIHALWGRSPEDLWAVGSQGLILYQGGLGWRAPVLPPENAFGKRIREVDLLGVCGDGRRLWVVGSYGTILTRCDGQWTVERPSNPDAHLHAVTVTPTGEVWACGTNGVLLRREQWGHWQQISPITTADLYAFAAAPAGDALTTVGEEGTILRRNPGLKPWRHMPSGTTANLLGAHEDAAHVLVTGCSAGSLRLPAGTDRWEVAEATPLGGGDREEDLIAVDGTSAIGHLGGIYGLHVVLPSRPALGDVGEVAHG